MTRRFFLLFGFILLFIPASGLHAQGLPAAEKAKIESLLAHVGGLKDAKFIRNGKDYDARTAVKFLRGKWEANERKIHSASGYIKIAATRSSTTGKEAFRAFLQRMDRCYRETVEDLVVFTSDDPSRAAAGFFIRGEYLATDEGLPPANGQKYHLRVGAFFEIREGKIARVTNYYNLAAWLRMVGG